MNKRCYVTKAAEQPEFVATMTYAEADTPMHTIEPPKVAIPSWSNGE
jgi:hypothetical protein